MWGALFTFLQTLQLWLYLSIYFFNVCVFCECFLYVCVFSKWCDYICFPFKGWCSNCSVLGEKRYCNAKVIRKHLIWRMWSCSYNSEWGTVNFGSWNSFFFHHIDGSLWCCTVLAINSQGRKEKSINSDSRSSGSEWPCGFQFLFLIPVCIFIVHILKNFCFEVHMQLQTIQHFQTPLSC